MPPKKVKPVMAWATVDSDGQIQDTYWSRDLASAFCVTDRWRVVRVRISVVQKRGKK